MTGGDAPRLSGWCEWCETVRNALTTTFSDFCWCETHLSHRVAPGFRTFSHQFAPRKRACQSVSHQADSVNLHVRAIRTFRTGSGRTRWCG